MAVRLLCAVVAVVVVAGIRTPLVSAASRQGPRCDVDTCAVATALEQACPCEVATSHGE